MMRDAIEHFHEQFAFTPVIENEERLQRKQTYVAVGMGGSGLIPGLVKMLHLHLDIIVHKDYGLPPLSSEALRERLVLLNSYSGNTEEVLAAFDEGNKQRCALGVVTTGGALLDRAKEHAIPFVELPKTGIQPRMSLGYQLNALLTFFRDHKGLALAHAFAKTFHAKDYEARGVALAEKLHDTVPVIYASRINIPLAYNWKIKLNETGKIPAFYNVLPELNHNEMTGFDVQKSTRHLSERMVFCFLDDADDHPRVRRRMDVLARLYERRGLRVERILIGGTTMLEKIFSTLLLADWIALYTAEYYGVEAEQVPMVEEFKKLIA